MKATGIVRRIDDLGRVVIPKEIRRTMRIREGDPLEIYTDREGGVIFKKYSPLGELINYAQDCCSALATVSGFNCAICDTDSVIAYSGSGKREVIERSISSECAKLIEDRKCINLKNGEEVSLIDDSKSPLITAACPIISEGDILGLVAFLTTPSKSIGMTEEKLLSACSLFLGKQLES